MVLALCLGLTILGYCLARLSTQGDVTEAINAEASHSAATIKGRLDISAQVLRSTAAMLMANRPVQSDIWRNYQQNLSRQGWPVGMIQLGYAQPIAPDEKVAFIAAIRADSVTDFKIHPSRGHSAHLPILFVGPETGTLGIGRPGFDLLSVPAMQQAITLATNTGAIAFHSVQINDTLLAGPKPEGNLQTQPTHAVLVLPLFSGNTVPPKVNERQQQAVGYIFALLNIDELLLSIDANRYRPVLLIELADHDTANVVDRGDYSSRLLRNVPLELFGGHWQASVMSPPISLRTAGNATAVAMSGTVISVLMFAILRLLSAIQLANRTQLKLASREIRHLQNQLAALIACSDQAIITIDHRQRIMTFNSGAEEVFCVRSATAVGLAISRFLPYRLKGAKRVDAIGSRGRKLSMYRLRNVLHEFACRYQGEHFPFDATIVKCGRWAQEGYIILLKDLKNATQPESIPAPDIDTSMPYHQPESLSYRLPIATPEIAGAHHFKISVAESVCDASFEWLSTTPTCTEHATSQNASVTNQPLRSIYVAQPISIRDFINITIHADDRAAVKQQWKQAFRSGAEVDCVYRMLRSDGSVQQVRHWMTQVAVQGNVRRFAGMLYELPQTTAPAFATSNLPAEDVHPIIQVDERRRWQPSNAETGRLYQQLQRRIMTFESAREEQQKRLAREMHDDFGQLLTAMKMDLIVLQGQLAKVDHRLSQQLGDVSELVDAMVVSVRRIIANLPPQHIDEHGLVKSLQLMADAHAKRHRIHCRLQVQPQLSPLDEVIVTPIYRIVQEALNNVAKHARATEIEIQIEQRNDRMHLSITDNGSGIRPSVLQNPSGFGLIGMRERIVSLNGTMTIETAAGIGTTILVVIPIDLEMVS